MKRQNPRTRSSKKVWEAFATIVAAVVPLVLVALLPWWWLPAAVALLVAWIEFTAIGQETKIVAALGIATLRQRLGSSSVVVIGTAGVVGVLVALLAMAAGFQATLQQTGRNDTVLILSSGAQAEIHSLIDRDTLAIVDTAPTLRKNSTGQVVASPEVVVSAVFRKKRGGTGGTVEIRGVGELAFELRPRLAISAGQKFAPGSREVIVGTHVREQFEGTDVGSTLQINGQPWVVVGVFDSGDAYNSEIWGDAEVVASAFHRGRAITSITAQLKQSADFEAFKAGIATDPRLRVEVQTTHQYYNRQSESLTHTIRILGTIVGAIMAIGAVFGALNTMYTAVSARGREIATLRAIGFTGCSVVASVMLETLLLAMIGGVLGATLAWMLFDGFTASTMGVMFALKVSMSLLWDGLQWALVIGFVGGLFPALRAIRVPIAVGLHEL